MSDATKLQRRIVNVAANRITRDEATFAFMRSCVRRAIRRREQQLERTLTVGEAESVCEHMGIDDVVSIIREEQA